jgi:hypothetical protein
MSIFVIYHNLGNMPHAGATERPRDVKNVVGFQGDFTGGKTLPGKGAFSVISSL